MIPLLDLKDAIALGVLLAGIVANFAAVKWAGAETQRLVGGHGTATYRHTDEAGVA